MDKRYLVFGIFDCYPSGGISDLEDSFDTLEEAIGFITIKIENETLINSFQIYDRIEGREVEFE